MDSILKKGLFLVTTAGAITAFPATAYADDPADDVMPQMGIEEVLNNCYNAKEEIAVEEYLVPTEKGEYLDMAFANVQSFLYIRSEPTTASCIPIMPRRSLVRWVNGPRFSPAKSLAMCILNILL